MSSFSINGVVKDIILEYVNGPDFSKLIEEIESHTNQFFSLKDGWPVAKVVCCTNHNVICEKMKTKIIVIPLNLWKNVFNEWIDDIDDYMGPCFTSQFKCAFSQIYYIGDQIMI